MDSAVGCRRAGLASERGSIPLVLLAAIILAGVIVALFTTVNTGVDTARQDRDFHAAIQVADVGIQQAFALVRDGEVESTCTGGECTGSTGDGGTYSATYEEVGQGYLVTSRGEKSGRARTLQALIDIPAPFRRAGIIGLDEVRLAGAFQSSPGAIVGTAGEWNFSGAGPCSNVGGLEAYGPEVDSECGIQPETVIGRTWPNLAEQAFEEGVCHGEDPIGEYPTDLDAADRQVYGETYCVTKIDFRAHSPLQGDPSDGPVKIYVKPPLSTGTVTVNQRANTHVNWPGTDPENAIDLQIYVAGGRVEIGAGNPKFSGLVWAPESYCQMKGTPLINGALVCAVADMRGNFTSDPNLDGFQIGEVGILTWDEIGSRG